LPFQLAGPRTDQTPVRSFRVIGTVCAAEVGVSYS
jgi:hypothetical protein